MPIAKLESIGLADLQHAAAVCEYVADHAPALPEFAELAQLMTRYAELCELYYSLDDEGRALVELGYGRKTPGDSECPD